MFLVVFVTLVISIIGLYAQVISLQATKIYHSQYGLMQTMLSWHGAAVSLVKPYLVGGGSGTILNIANICEVTANPSISFNGTTYAVCAASTGINLFLQAANLPSGYTMANFTFYSLVYQTPSAPIADYVVTFVYSVDSSGNLTLPGSGGTSTGYSMSSLSQQFARAVPADMSYGTVTQQSILTVYSKSTGATGAACQYPVPRSIPVGALALISAAS